MKSSHGVPATARLVLATACMVLFASAPATPQFSPHILLNRDYRNARDRWFMRGRTAGRSSADLRYRAQQAKSRNRNLRPWLLTQSPGIAAAAGGWQPLGPAPLSSDATGQGWQDYGPVSGRVTAIVVDPADATGNTVYIGGAHGGLWRSQNAASGTYGDASSVSWKALTDGEATLATGAIALQPGNTTGNLSNLILVGTGEANASGDSYYGLGFLRSTDRGNTWTLVSSADGGTHPFQGLAVSKIVFSTAQRNTVVAGVGLSPVGQIEGADASTPYGIYYSSDAGASWHLATVQDSGITIAPDSPRGIVYNPASAKFYAAIRRHGFYSSADGITWARLPNQPGGGVLAQSNCPTITSSATCPIVRGELAVVPGRNEMYAWFTDFDSSSSPPDIDHGVWKTLDGGATWTSISTAGIDSCGDSVGGCGTEQGEYNMVLAAMPSGSATDLYAGAVNLFKCTISTANPSCVTATFLNLTHVYGCPPYFGSIAHVHPNQHALDFALVNGNTQAVMYFGNDGGVYRALDGFSGLTTGSCGGTNQFDSLNGTLGSLTQFISIAEHPSNPDVLLGGTAGNGSPATTSATTSVTWTNVNNGDGSFTAIDPTAPNSWFTSHPDIGNQQLAVEHCSLGINCHAQDFASDLVASSYDLNGDDGGFYFPYILDPQAASEMLVGTCRVWQGPSSGGTFSAISDNFETGIQNTCTGSEANTVTAIAAGGPKKPAGTSKVVYATTSGFGPLTSILGLPAGGRVFVTTDSSASLMTDVTGTINPVHYPASGVAMDASDATGQTAYITVMGFGTPHVYKTTDAGVTWSDFSGTGSTQIPDAPANAVVVDDQAGMVYVGTDVGVFGSPTAAPTWIEVGPTSGTGFLPDVPVIDLKLLGGLLRAATYGRGVWQITLVPGFQITMANSSRTIFPTQQATFNGTVTALGGYNSLVSLSCTAGATPPPATCTLTPTTVTPTPSGASFQLKTKDVIGDYLFDVHAAGSDSGHITQDQTITLQVVDFSLGAPNPATITANRPNTSNPTTFPVSAFGSFNQAVQLTCAGLPAGATCNFLPSSSVSPTAAVPVTVTLTISTSQSTATGSYPITISASTTNPTGTRSRSLTLVVTALPDYVLAISNSPQSALVNQTAAFSGTLTAANGYASAVNLSCGTGAPPTCSPATVTPTPGGASFSITVSSDLAQSYSFDIVAVGTDASHISHSSPVLFDSLLDFSISSSNSVQSIRPGQSATFSLDLSPIGGKFENPVTLQYAACPAQAICSFNPASISVGSGATAVSFTVATAGPNKSSRQVGTRAPFFSWAVITLFGLCLGRPKSATRTKRAALPLLLLVAVSFVFLQACGGGASSGPPPPPPPPPDQVKVTVSPAPWYAPPWQVYTSAQQQFTAAVTGTSDNRVTWKVNTVPGGNSAVGTVDANGLYTAPGSVPSPATVAVTAVSEADRLKSDTADVTILAATPSGTYTITASAISGSLTRSTTVTLDVVP